jgi:hypothetical protein
MGMMFDSDGIAATLWYPIASFERLLELLRIVEGGHGSDFFVAYGRESAADTLKAPGVEIILKGARAFGARAGIPLIKLAKLFYNVSEWEFVADNLEDFTVHVSDAEALSEPLRYVALGFIRHLVCEFVGREVAITSERASPNRIIYRTL